MNKQILKSICVLLMCDDPSNLDRLEREKLEEWANERSKEAGFTDWVDAYHLL